jgi:hypothetical protein
MTREELLKRISELIRAQAEWHADNLADPEWADGVTEEILDLVEEGYTL